MSTAALIALGLQLLPQLIAAGRDVSGLIKTMQDVNGQTGDPTPEQWAALHAIEDSLRDRLHSDDH